MNQTAQIVAKYVNPPKPGKTYGSVKDEAGQYWDIDPRKVQVEQGGTYTVEYSTREWQGKTYRTIQGAHPATPAVAHAAAPVVAKVGNGQASSDDARVVPAHVSNILGHAIQAGFISEPHQLVTWAQWAMEAARKMNTPPTWQGDPPAHVYENDDLPEMRG